MKNKSEKIPKISVSLNIVEFALSAPDGNVLGVLRGEMPKIARAEDKAKAKTRVGTNLQKEELL